MKKPETIAELEHEVVKRAEEHTIAKAELDAKTAEDQRLQEKEAQKKREHEDAKAKLAEARAEEKRKEFARALPPHRSSGRCPKDGCSRQRKGARRGATLRAAARTRSPSVKASIQHGRRRGASVRSKVPNPVPWR